MNIEYRWYDLVILSSPAWSFVGAFVFIIIYHSRERLKPGYTDGFSGWGDVLRYLSIAWVPVVFLCIATWWQQHNGFPISHEPGLLSFR